MSKDGDIDFELKKLKQYIESNFTRDGSSHDSAVMVANKIEGIIEKMQDISVGKMLDKMDKGKPKDNTKSIKIVNGLKEINQKLGLIGKLNVLKTNSHDVSEQQKIDILIRRIEMRIGPTITHHDNSGRSSPNSQNSLNESVGNSSSDGDKLLEKHPRSPRR